MNFKSYIDWMSETLEDEITVLFPGSFKPPTYAHVDLIKAYVEHPHVKEVKVLIGPGVRNNITQKEAVVIAKLLLSKMEKVVIDISNYPTPIMAAYEYIMKEAQPGTYALAASKKEDDYKRVEKFVKDFAEGGRYYDKKPKDVKVIELLVNTEPRLYKDRTDELNGTPISASVLRRDILNDDFYNFETNYPGYGEYETREIWKILKPIIKENINEKFTQDSDPIHDLGIGIQKQIDDWIKTTDAYKNNYNKESDKLWICAVNGKTSYVKYLLEHGHEKYVTKYGDHALYWACHAGYSTIAKMLLDAGANINTSNGSVLIWAKDHGNKRILKVLEDHLEKQKKKKKRKINEKFIENSDPIKDLGIGVFSKHNFNNYDEAAKFLVTALPAILKMDKIPKDIIELSNNWFKWPYFYEILHYCRKFIYVNGEKINAGANFDYIYNSLQKKIIDMGFGEKYDNNLDVPNPYKNEIYEKFTQDSDPVKDLGIRIKKQLNDFLKKEKEGPGWGGLDFNDTAVQLRVCAYENKEKFIEYILSKGVDTNSYDSIAALRNAARNQNESICLMLIDAGIDINKVIEISGSEEKDFLRKLQHKKLNESTSSTSSKNIHMTHIEDLVLLGNDNSIDWMVNIFKNLYSKLKGSTSKEDIKLSIKFDGSPSVFSWSYFNELKKPGVAIKSLFAKNPKILYTDEDVDRYYSEQPDLANKLKILLKYIPSLNIPKNEIWQGDLLFDRSTLKDEGKQYSFHPNTIVYKVNKDSEIGKEIATSDIGLIWHTHYTGTSLEDAKANYDIDLSKLNKNPKVFMADPYIASLAGYITLTQDENIKIKSLIDDAEKMVNNLDKDQNYAVMKNDEDIVNMFTLFQNHIIKKSLKFETPQDYIENFVLFISDRYKAEAEKRKGSSTRDKIIDKGNKIVNKLDDLYTTLQTVISLLYKAKQLKTIFIEKLNHIGKFEKYLETKDGKFQSTSEEGFAVSDISGNIVKIVDREQFSYANFSPDVIKGWAKK